MYNQSLKDKRQDQRQEDDQHPAGGNQRKRHLKLLSKIRGQNRYGFGRYRGRKEQCKQEFAPGGDEREDAYGDQTGRRYR